MKKILPGICMFASLFLVGTLSSCDEKECNHQEVTIEGYAATCTEKGLTDGKKCSVCQEILVVQEEIAALGHTEEEVEGKSATCTEAGNESYTHCTVCNKNFDAEGNELEKVVIDALGHSEEAVAEKAATCTEDGNVAYTHCSVCDKNFDDEGNELETIVIEAPGHKFVEGKCFCGEEDPNYVPPHTHKFIDGSCECGEEYVAQLGGWTLVNEIKDGDNVLIGAPAYGKLLSANKVNASSYYNKGVNYTAEDFSNVTDAEIFVVTVNGDGTYTFTSLTGVVIALASDYSSLNATGTHKSWSLTEKSEGVFYVKNTGRGNYLEWYEKMGNWSTYSTSSLSDLFEISFYSKVETVHVHNYISNAHEATCTEDGYTTFACRCGDSYTVEGQKATGHEYSSSVTAPTCTEDGYTTFTCKCGDSYTVEGQKATGHNFVDGSCACGEVDPDAHVHSYSATVTAPTCTVKGFTTYTCACGDSYTADEVDVVNHVDANLDITCDFDGCTKRILPAADSKVSLFTANHMIIVSLSSNYYVEGVVTEITDNNNGIFIITDDDGYQILIRLPKNADGVAYSSWTVGKVVVGDTVSVYGKPTKNSSAPTSQKAKVEGGKLTILNHTHVFSEATCTEPAKCACLAIGTAALGHIDENNDDACDRCTWNMKLTSTSIVVCTDTTLSNGVLDSTETYWTWSSENFDVIIAKGTSTFTIYKTAKTYMQLKKQNTLTVDNKNGLKIHSVTISATNANQLANLQKAIGTQYSYETNNDKLSITIILDTTEDFVLVNQSTTTAYINNVEVVFEN